MEKLNDKKCQNYVLRILSNQSTIMQALSLILRDSGAMPGYVKYVERDIAKTLEMVDDIYDENENS